MVAFLCKVQRAGERKGCGHLRRTRQQGIRSHHQAIQGEQKSSDLWESSSMIYV